MSDRYCKIFYEGKKSDIENLMKEKVWKFELHEMDNKTLFCKIGDEFYDELEFFKGLQVDELEITKILDIQEIDELDYNKEVSAIKEKEEREKNQENDERNADVNEEKERVRLESNDDEKERDEVEDDKERFEDNNNEETSKNNITSEKEKLIEKHSSPKKQNINENKNLEPEEKNYEKLFDLKDVLLPSKNKLEEKDIMNTLLSKDYLIKFIVIASGVISFLCFFEK